jgi:hypothetical protein
MMSDCEMQRIDKPTIYSAFWNSYPAGDLPGESTEEKGSSDKASRIASLTSSRLSSLGDDG